MCSAVFLWNIVGKATHVFLIRIVPLQSHFHPNAIFSLRSEVENVIQMVFALIDIFYKLRQTTFVVIHVFEVDTLITQNNTHPCIQE